MATPLYGDPKSWKKFVVAILPHNICYERHTDDHIKQIIADVLNLSSDKVGITPRNKSIFQCLDQTDLKSIQARMKEDEKLGLARKKQQVEDNKKLMIEKAKIAAEKIEKEKTRASELAKKSKHMSRAAREKIAEESIQRQKDLENSLLEETSVETDPVGITGALANIRAPPSPINRSKGNGKAASSSSSSSNSTSVIPATEDEGAADVIYILSLADVIANFQKKLPIDSDPTEASMEKFPEAILNALSSLLSSDRNMVNCVLEVTSQRPVRAGWVNPAQPLLDIQAGIGPKATKSNALLWADVTVVQVTSDLPTLRQRPREEVSSNISRRLGDAAVDRYLYDEWLSAATVIEDFPSKKEHVALADEATMHYQQLSNQFPCEAACSVVTVCDVLIEACVRAATSTIEAKNVPKNATTNVKTSPMVDLWAEMDRQAASQKNDAQTRENLLSVVYHGDEAQSRLEIFNLCDCYVGGRSLLSIERHMLEDCARVPGGRGRAGMPREPIKPESERGAELNELLTFLNTTKSSINNNNNNNNEENDATENNKEEENNTMVLVTPEQLAHTRTVNLFQDMLHGDDPDGTKIWKDNQAFHRRKFREKLGPTTLSQVMTKAMLDNDKTLTFYDPDTDRILVACHTRTWDRRRNTTRFITSDTTTGYCSVPPGFARWRVARERRLRAKVRAQRVVLKELREKSRVSKNKKNPAEMEVEERAIAAAATRGASLSAPVLFQMGKEEAIAVEDEIVSLYPADNAVVRIYRMGIKGAKEKYRWASVSKDGHTFGLRPQLNIAAVHNGLKGLPLDTNEDASGKSKKKKEDEIQNFSIGFCDGSRCVVEQGPAAPLKPDGNGTVNLTYTDECTGLVVECCSDGSTRQRIAGKGTDVANQEICRVITSQGQVIRYLNNGGIEVLLSDGNVCRWMVPEKKGDVEVAPLPGWVVTNSSGNRTRAVPRPNSDENKKSNQKDNILQTMKEWQEQWRYLVEEPPIETKMTTDTLVLSKVVQREDGTRIITEPDGTRRVEHHDGTIIMVQAGGDPDDRSNEEDWGYVTVRCPGFATVEIDIDVAMNADTHASGGRIALTKGGLQQRNVVTMEDGSAIRVTYNTKFTATVNGAVKLIKPNGVEVQAHDDLTVEMRTGELQAAIEEARRQAAASTVISEGRSEKDLTAGAYFADLKKGHMWSADPEHNEMELVLPPVDPKSILKKTKPPVEVEDTKKGKGKDKGKKKKEKKSAASNSMDNFGGSDNDEEETEEWDQGNSEPLASEGAEIKFSLSGESVEGVQAPASINAPIEPRLFVLEGNGYGYELMRDSDVEEYRRGLGVLQARTETVTSNVFMTPMAVPRIEITANEDEKQLNSTAAAASTNQIQSANADVVPGGHVHVVSCNLTARKSALFTAQGLERGQEPGLPLTLKEKANPVMEQRRAILVRQMIEIQPQSTEAISSVEQAEKLCEMWRDDRDSNQDRFDVDDPRPRAAIEAERNMSAAILASRQKVANGGEPQSRPESKSSLRRARKNKMNEENAMENESVVDNNGVKEEPRTEEGNDEVGREEEFSAELYPTQQQEQQQQQQQQEEADEFNAFNDNEQDQFESNGSLLESNETEMLYPKAPLPQRTNLMQYTSSSNAGNVLGLSEDVKNAQGIGGFWRDQNPDISAPTSKQVEEMNSASKVDENDEIQAVFDRDVDVSHLVPANMVGKQTLVPIGNSEEAPIMVAGSGRNMAKTLRENSSASKFAHPSPFSNTTQGTQKFVGFQVKPQRLMVGDLCSGGVYKCKLMVTNSGQSLGRFRVGRRGKKTSVMTPGCDSGSHRIRVIYQPGAIAAGMKRKMEVEIAALATTSNGTEIDDYVEVVASDQVIRIPIIGKIVDATKHDRRRVGKQATLVSKVAV